MNIEYDLSSVSGFMDYLQTKDVSEKYFTVRPYLTKTNTEYTLIRYNKELLHSENIATYGLLRSIIVSDSKVVSFAPPKSMSSEVFMNKYPLKTDDLIAEEFVEGTMINVFYDNKCGVNGCWQIATRNTVGADVSFYKHSSKTFHDMFIDACQTNNLNINTLNPLFCYSFVLQHPENRIVMSFKKPQLYLVGVYLISNEEDTVRVQESNISDVRQYGLWDTTTVQFPKQYEFNSYEELIAVYASANTPYNVMGVVVKNLATGERMKIRNPIYEEVRQLRGNQPKLQYQYLCLRSSGKLPEFLKYYPETKAEMSKFREQVHLFTNTLHQNYIDCYVKKDKSLKLFSDQYRTHMYKLHEIYLNELRQKHLFVTSSVVIKYVNELPPSLLMYSLNYNLRKRMIDNLTK